MTSFWEFARLLSCMDYREICDKRKASVYMSRLSRYMREGKVYVMHLAYMAPLGVGAAWAVKREPRLWRRLFNERRLTNTVLEDAGVPLARYVARIVLVPGEVHVWWYLPDTVDDSQLSSWSDEYRRGVILPVHSCRAPRRRMEQLLGIGRIALKTPLMAFILAAVLDYYKLLPLRRIVTSIVAAARGSEDELNVAEQLRWRYVKRYYDMLSSHNIIARYRVLPRDGLWRRGVKYYITVGSGAAATLYDVAARVGTVGHIFYTREAVAATAVLTESQLSMLLEKVSPDEIDVRAAVRVYGAPFPYEMYDPIGNRWLTEPNRNMMRLLRRFRLTAMASSRSHE